MFKGIRKLMPGHFLTIEKGILQIEEYWNLSFQAVEMGDAESRAAQLLDLLKDSVRLHLRSDVPLGVFLSGGLDSSTMVALAKSEVSSSLKTYSVAFDMGRAFDERQYARTVAETFRTEHHEIVLTPKEFQDLLPTFVWHMDEPVSEAPAIQLYCVAKLAANDVKVVLSGEGADELFGGYDIYRYMLILERLRGLGCEKVFRWAKPLAKMFGVHKVEKYLSLGVLTLEERYAGPSMLSPMNWSMMYNREFLDMLNTSSASDFQGLYYMHSRDWDHLSRMLYLDTKMWLPNDLLIKADKMTMAHSLELRVPFLDHRVVEFAANLPSHDKLTMNE
ncbi:MAG: asparagine synthase C-terminal domain-containing protein, partial [Nitrospirota bacterium]|nr:asparagine synthase C-terminal domain-containing protein [Nitrospirota bacterium]